jgi:hypothetical protein
MDKTTFPQPSRTPRLVLPLQTMDGVITTRGSASRRRRDAVYAATHTEITLYAPML